MAEPIVSREADPLSVRALTRGLSILGLFDVDHREWTIDEMAEQTGLVRMTVYRMARTLESMAFLVRDPSTNRYRLGPATLAMCYVSDDHSDFVRGGPTVPGGARAGDRGVGDLGGRGRRIPGVRRHHQHHASVQAQTAPGRILGDIATVHGKIFAAFKSPAEREAILAKPRTHTDSPHRHRQGPDPGRAGPDSRRRRGLRHGGLLPGSLLGGRPRARPVRSQWRPPSPWSSPRGASDRPSARSAPRRSRQPPRRSRPIWVGRPR